MPAGIVAPAAARCAADAGGRLPAFDLQKAKAQAEWRALRESPQGLMGLWRYPGHLTDWTAEPETFSGGITDADDLALGRPGAGPNTTA